MANDSNDISLAHMDIVSGASFKQNPDTVFQDGDSNKVS